MDIRNVTIRCMTQLLEYEGFVDSTCYYPDHHTLSPREWGYVGTGLASEAGETVGEVNKALRNEIITVPPCNFCDIVNELGDVYYYLTRLRQMLGISEEELRVINVVKLYERLTSDPDRYIKGAKPEEVAQWPFKNLSYEDALKLMRHIESLITSRNVTDSTDTDM